MEDDDSKSFDNLSKLARDLEEIEQGEGGVKDPARASQVREGLIAAMRSVYKSHYEFAEWLDRYRNLYKAKKTSTVAIERIAATYGCSARTLYRLLSNYDDAQQLPLVFIDVMREEGLDPVRGENLQLVKALAETPKPASRAEAEASLNVARAKVVKMQTPVASTPQQPELEEFATRVVRMFKARYGSYSGPDRDDQIRFVLEKVVNVLGADVHELRTYGRPDRVPKPAKGTR
jgi:hypothetical protein